ncbi:MAG: hypothetical protein R3250_11965 [Melioribacteraceae bacterium]|nr:hypothetical protein [Melioribacteraceae bacterium]
MDLFGIDSTIGFLGIPTLILTLFTGAMIYDALVRPIKNKLFWIILMLLLGVLATVPYGIWGRNRLITTNAADKESDDTGTPSNEQTLMPLKTEAKLAAAIALIAKILGVLAIGFFAIVAVAMYQCSRDPKCI